MKQFSPFGNIPTHDAISAPTFNARKEEKVISDNMIYGTKMWRCIKAEMKKREPLCRMCRAEGRYVVAIVVDHIIPARIALDRIYDMTNLQRLCVDCHNKKTKEDYAKYPELYGLNKQAREAREKGVAERKQLDTKADTEPVSKHDSARTGHTNTGV